MIGTKTIVHLDFDSSLVDNFAMLQLEAPRKESKYSSYVNVPSEKIKQGIKEVCAEGLISG